VTYPFKRPKLTIPPPSKRSRQNEPPVTESGTFTESRCNTKYSVMVNSFTQNSSATKFPLINASNSCDTWKRHQSALTCFFLFCAKTGTKAVWPLQSEVINSFCHWALTEKNLKSSTVKAYLSSMALYHRLNGLDESNCSNYLSKLIIRGAENLEITSCSKQRQRNVVTLPVLKILGHEVANSMWDSLSKQIFWVAACLSFFGSLRMGELLSKNISSWDPDITLLWSDILDRGDSLLVHIKSPKSRTKGGEYVDIFPFPGHNCCPVNVFKTLKSKTEGIRKENEPIFKFRNGNLLTKEVFNNTLGELLNKKLNAKFSGHSFRAGIPSTLARFPELSNDSHIMGWGRWTSNAYLSYTRLKTDQKRKIFSKIVEVLNVK
jgi:hypothetical protein